MTNEIEIKLEKFTEKLRKMPEIRAVYYTGSTASKTWDKYSDVDVDIVVKDKDYKKIVKRLPKLLEMWGGEVKFCNHYPNQDEYYAFIGENYFKVEIDPINSERMNHFSPKGKRIAFDKDGNLTQALKKAKHHPVKIEPKEFIQFLLDTRNNFIYIVRHYARGQKLSAASELGNISGKLFCYLGKIKGMEDHVNLRNAEKHLTKKEWDFLKISSCKSLEKEELRRAIKANWEYMKYLERLYEKKTSKKLNLKCNDAEILNILNKTLDEAK